MSDSSGTPLFRVVCAGNKPIDFEIDSTGEMMVAKCGERSVTCSRGETSSSLIFYDAGSMYEMLEVPVLVVDDEDDEQHTNRAIRVISAMLWSQQSTLSYERPTPSGELS